MTKVVIPPLTPIPRGTNIGQRDMAFLKYAAELQEANREFSGWIARTAQSILQRRMSGATKRATVVQHRATSHSRRSR